MSRIVLNMEYGGYGDRIPCMMFAEDWKLNHPEDDIYISGPHVNDIKAYWNAPYISGFLSNADAVATADKFISTHHLHCDGLYPFNINIATKLIYYDIMTELSRLLPIRKRLNLLPNYRVEAQFNQFKSDITHDIPYVGLHIRQLDGRSCIDPDLSAYLNIYKELMTYYESKGYKVVVAGDYDIGGMYLDKLYPGNSGLQLWILANSKFFIGSNSGFTYISSFLRYPEQSPGLFLNFNYLGPGNWYRGLDIRIGLDEYIRRGGESCEKLSYYQDVEGIREFIYDIPHTSSKVIDFFKSAGYGGA